MGRFFLIGTLILSGCNNSQEILFLSDPYGAVGFPSLESEVSQVAASQGLRIRWVVIPPQAEPGVILDLVPPDFQGNGIFCSNLYEDEVFKILAREDRTLISWGYGKALLKGDLNLGWEDETALKKVTETVALQSDLLKTQKPLIFAVAMGSDETAGSLESAIRSVWPPNLGFDRLWFYKLANLEDRNGAIQAANNLVAQNLDMVYLSAGKLNGEFFRILVGGGINMVVKDWDVTGQNHSRIVFSLERNWPEFWKKGLTAWKDGQKGEVNTPFTLNSHFSTENSPLKAFHIR
ncbi:MAG: hypothetical protein A2Z96_02435 [Spirochaetes bacterium GWB1_48_6]|nr:MAG: hypothetical protein A2Z96_02435 [Spirochaetes bacterium GWB1_48_6]